jgi:hypothetical protein
VTSSRCPNRPTLSKAIPFRPLPAGRLANRRACPAASTSMTAGWLPGSIAKISFIPNEQWLDGLLTLLAEVR